MTRWKSILRLLRPYAQLTSDWHFKLFRPLTYFGDLRGGENVILYVRLVIRFTYGEYLSNVRNNVSRIV